MTNVDTWRPVHRWIRSRAAEARGKQVHYQPGERSIMRQLVLIVLLFSMLVEVATGKGSGTKLEVTEPSSRSSRRGRKSNSSSNNIRRWVSVDHDEVEEGGIAKQKRYYRGEHVHVQSKDPIVAPSVGREDHANRQRGSSSSSTRAGRSSMPVNVRGATSSSSSSSSSSRDRVEVKVRKYGGDPKDDGDGEDIDDQMDEDQTQGEYDDRETDSESERDEDDSDFEDDDGFESQDGEDDENDNYCKSDDRGTRSGGSIAHTPRTRRYGTEVKTRGKQGDRQGYDSRPMRKSSRKSSPFSSKQAPNKENGMMKSMGAVAGKSANAMVRALQPKSVGLGEILDTWKLEQVIGKHPGRVTKCAATIEFRRDGTVATSYDGRESVSTFTFRSHAWPRACTIEFEAKAFQGPWDEEPIWKIYKGSFSRKLLDPKIITLEGTIYDETGSMMWKRRVKSGKFTARRRPTTRSGRSKGSHSSSSARHGGGGARSYRGGAGGTPSSSNGANSEPINRGGKRLPQKSRGRKSYMVKKY